MFRSRVVMERFRFGKGDYKYFHYPLPKIVQQLRECTYPRLAKIANEWRRRWATKALNFHQLTKIFSIDAGAQDRIYPRR
jgi:hypothetical protein